MKKLNKINDPFGCFCYNLGFRPTVYSDALTYEEQLLWLIDFLQKTVIPAVNDDTEAVEELQGLYIELKSYVDNYFDNLDVQEEINNKLDDMAESGQLTDIIAQYLQLAGVLAYDTVDDLKEAQNIVDGSTCLVLGKDLYNDGKTSLYKIRTITSGDVVDEDNIISLELSNTLIGEKIPKYDINELNSKYNEIIDNNYINVKINGCYGDGVHDDIEIIQSLIDNNPHKTLFFPDGTYLISEPINIETGNDNQVNIIFSQNAILKTNETIDSLIEVGKNEGSYNRYAEGFKVTIEGGILDATNTTQGLLLTANQKNTNIKDLTIINVETYGIYIDRGINTSVSSDALIENVTINGKGSDIGGTGIYLYGMDNKIINSRINRCKTGFFINGGNYIENSHILAGFSTQLPQSSNLSDIIGFKFDGYGTSFISNSYSDTMTTGVEIVKNADVIISGLEFGWWYVDNTIDINCFKIDSDSVNYNIKANNIEISIPNTNNFYGLNLSNAGYQYRNFLPTYENIKIKNLIFKEYLSKIHDDDPICCLAIQDITNITTHDPWTQTLDANKYYPIAYLKQGYYDFNFSNASDQIVNVKCSVGSSSTLTLTNIYSGSHVNEYSLALCNLSQNSDNRYEALLCFKTTSNTTSFNPHFSKVDGWNHQLFTHRNFHQNTALVLPTVAVETSFNS